MPWCHDRRTQIETYNFLSRGLIAWVWSRKFDLTELEMMVDCFRPVGVNEAPKIPAEIMQKSFLNFASRRMSIALLEGFDNIGHAANCNISLHHI